MDAVGFFLALGVVDGEVEALDLFTRLGGGSDLDPQNVRPLGSGVCCWNRALLGFGIGVAGSVRESKFDSNLDIMASRSVSRAS